MMLFNVVQLFDHRLDHMTNTQWLVGSRCFVTFGSIMVDLRMYGILAVVVVVVVAMIGRTPFAQFTN